MTKDDVIYRSRLRLFALAQTDGQPQGRMPDVGRSSLDLLPVPASAAALRTGVAATPGATPTTDANAISPMVEQRSLAMAIAWRAGGTPATTSGACFAATASATGPSAWPWSAASPRLPSPKLDRPV